MEVIKATEIAHALYRTHGDKAEVVAARREKRFKEAGNDNEAANWRAIRGSVRRMRGANQS